jgi:hypothetical protein
MTSEGFSASFHWVVFSEQYRWRELVAVGKRGRVVLRRSAQSLSASTCRGIPRPSVREHSLRDSPTNAEFAESLISLSTSRPLQAAAVRDHTLTTRAELARVG